MWFAKLLDTGRLVETRSTAPHLLGEIISASIHPPLKRGRLATGVIIRLFGFCFRLFIMAQANGRQGVGS